jgi:hypothetical protein
LPRPVNSGLYRWTGALRSTRPFSVNHIIALVSATTLVREAMSHKVVMLVDGEGCQSSCPSATEISALSRVPATTTAPGNAESFMPARRMYESVSRRPGANAGAAAPATDAGGAGGAEAQFPAASETKARASQIRALIAEQSNAYGYAARAKDRNTTRFEAFVTRGLNRP